jgi:hypothetical protein
MRVLLNIIYHIFVPLITCFYYTYFYLFHFFNELTSARCGARASALAPVFITTILQ